MKRFTLAAAAALFGCAAQAQIYHDSAGTIVPGIVPLVGCANGANCAAPVSSSNPLPVSGMFNASLSGFTPTPSYKQLTSSGTSSVSTAVPTGTVDVVYNTSANVAYCTYGNSSVAATSSGDVIQANSWVAFTVPSSATTIACISPVGTLSINISGGSGLPTGSGGGGGGGATAILPDTLTSLTAIIAGDAVSTSTTASGQTQWSSGGSALTSGSTDVVNLNAIQQITLYLSGTFTTGTVNVEVTNAPPASITANTAVWIPAPNIYPLQAYSANVVGASVNTSGYSAVRFRGISSFTGSVTPSIIETTTTTTSPNLYNAAIAGTTSTAGSAIGSWNVVGYNSASGLEAGWCVLVSSNCYHSVDISSVNGTAVTGTAIPVSQPVNVTPTGCSGTITTGGTAQTLISASTTLHGFSVTNIDATTNSGEPLYISLTATASLTSTGSLPLPPPTSSTTLAGAGNFTAPLGLGTNHGVSVIAAGTGHKFNCVYW